MGINTELHLFLPFRSYAERCQDKYENFFFVVDLHAITVPQDPKQLKAGVINAAATYLAAGIDPEKSKVFVQVQYLSRSLPGLNHPLA